MPSFKNWARDAVMCLYIPVHLQVIFRVAEPLVQAASKTSPAPSEYKLNLMKEEQSRAIFSERVKQSGTVYLSLFQFILANT